METRNVNPSGTSQEEMESRGALFAADSGYMSPVPRDAEQVIRQNVGSHEIRQVSHRASGRAAAASGSGACSGADQLDERGSYEAMVDKFVRQMREQSRKTEAPVDSSAEQGERIGVNGGNEEEEGSCRRRRRKRRVSFKRLGSVGRPFYRTKVVEEKDPYECFRCHVQFQFKRELEVHLRAHTGTQLLPCDFCPLEFPTGRMLSNHCAKKHSNMSLSCLGQCPRGTSNRN